MKIGDSVFNLVVDIWFLVSEGKKIYRGLACWPAYLPSFLSSSHPLILLSSLPFFLPSVFLLSFLCYTGGTLFGQAACSLCQWDIMLATEKTWFCYIGFCQWRTSRKQAGTKWAEYWRSEVWAKLESGRRNRCRGVNCWKVSECWTACVRPGHSIHNIAEGCRVDLAAVWEKTEEKGRESAVGDRLDHRDL